MIILIKYEVPKKIEQGRGKMKKIINILTYKMCIKRIVNRRGASLSTPV